jgi:hypothetical protein
VARAQRSGALLNELSQDQLAEALFPGFDNGKQITRDQLRTKLAE